MDLRLSHRDEHNLQAALDAALAPMKHSDLNAWLADVTRRLKALLGADKGFAMIDPAAPEPTLFTEGLTRDEVLTYPREVVTLDRRFGLWQRQLALRVWNRESLNRPHMEAYLNSPYYHEYILPVGAHDALGMTCRIGEPGVIATAMFHHDSPAAKPFGDRGLGLLRVMEPAFRAGVHAMQRFSEVRVTLFDVVDRISVPVFILGAAGRELHRNLASRTFLANCPEVADSICAAVQRIGRDVLRLQQRPSSPTSLHATAVVWTRHGPHILNGTSTAGIPGSGAARILVTMESMRGPLLRPGYQVAGLTKRQSEIATLLSEGLPDRRIAERLSISVHTVKRHVEAILTKLDVTSRHDVGDAVARIATRSRAHASRE